eukprot:GHVS01097389.1.p1 GENE.GHVS01097389.1~~GHVS01097389.1.p1  ORF type:complete len:158 (-),score=13.38 GHVS01097389.1:243-716(-)
MANRSSSALFVLIVVAALLVLFALNGVESAPLNKWECRELVAERLGIKKTDDLYHPFVTTEEFEHESKSLVFHTPDDDVDGIGVSEVSDSGELGPVLPVIAEALSLNGKPGGALLIVTATIFFVSRHHSWSFDMMPNVSAVYYWSGDAIPINRRLAP